MPENPSVARHSPDLTPADLALHERLGIPADLLRAAGVRRLDDAEARDQLSINGKPGNFAGVLYLYSDPRTGQATTSRVRLDHAPLNSDGTPTGKYRAPYGDNRHLYFGPDAGPLLADTSVPIVFVEAEKAVLAITAAADRAGRRLLPVALGGCWSWRGSVGKDTNATGARMDVKGPLPDFNILALTGRDVTILFDARPNNSVRAARRAFARELRQRGADVRHAHLPDDHAAVNGPDDLIAACGDAALWAVVDGATAEEFRRHPKTDAILSDDLDNIRLALSRLGTDLRYDAFAQQVLIDGAAADDVAVDRLWIRINDTCGFRPLKDTLRTVVTVEAHRTTVHPVKAYLDSLTWDSTPRLDGWLTTYGGADLSPYTSAVGALPLIAAVRRVRQPGAKFDELLVLESPQGTFKSSALRALCPDEDLFSDDLPLGVDSKAVIERTSGRWILEASELHGNRGREAEQLKAFLSRQVDVARLAYARLPVTVPRQFIMIGTTNLQAAYLKDSTGGRRFWPVKVQGFDVAALQRDRDQLWAEAAYREAAGESIRLPEALWVVAGEQQEARRAADPWEDVLEPLLDTEDDHVRVDALWSALGVEASFLDNRHADRVAAIVQRHGFVEKKKCRRGGGPVWHWLRPPTVPSSSEQRSGQPTTFLNDSKRSNRSKQYLECTEK